MSNWYQLKTFSLDNGRLVAVSYRQMNTTLTASNQPGQGPASLQDANDIAKASLIFGIGQLLDHYRDFDKYKAMYYSVMLNGLDGVNDASDAGLVIADIGAIALEATPFTSFAISFVSWAKTVLPASYNVISHLFDPMVMTSPYAEQELSIAPEVEASMRARYQNYSPAGTAYRLLALSWSPSISQIVIGGDKFQPNATLNFRFGLVGQEPLETWNTTLVNDQSDALFLGATLTKSLPRGCYLVSAVGPGTHGALQIAGNFLWIDGEPNYVPPQSIIVTTPGSGSSSPNRTCSNPVDVLTQYANLFNGVNCGGDITWFSAHPENGPSANSSSLYVPTNSIVKVSSNDDGGGETACFSETQEDLGSWKNKIQWAQLIPGGSCPPPPASDRYVVHTNDGDFTVTVGQTWDNSQNNRQTLGFDRYGSAHLKINHVNGNQRCWDESKSAQELQNDGDWWIQTRSIEIGSGYCPGMSGQLQVFNQANFQGSQNDIRAGNSRTYSDNDLKYSFRFTESGMSAKLTNADGRTRCWNTNVSNLQDHEDYWHRTVKIEVFGTDVCPVPVEVPEGANFAPGIGVKYSYFEYAPPMVGLPIPNVWTPISTGYSGNFVINQVPHRDNDFAIRFESCLTVPSTGNYTFFTTSDDGSELYLNGQKVVDNDGYHANIEKSGSVNLTAGVHPLAVDFFQGGVDRILGVSWQGPGFGKQWIPNSNLAMTGCSWELKSQLPVTKPDLFAIAKTGLTAGTTSVKVYSGSSNFSSVLGTYSTSVEEYIPQNYGWAFELGDYNSMASRIYTRSKKLAQVRE
ncbi:MAG: PA14 domain-containing protein [Caldilineaceae bacterium]